MSHQLALVGQKGQPCCASVMPLSDGKLDIAFYTEKPVVVEQGLKTNSPPEPVRFLQVASTSGWGLKVIQELEKIRRDYADEL